MLHNIYGKQEIKNNLFTGKTVTRITPGAVGKIVDGGGNVLADGTPVASVSLQEQK